MYLAAALCLLLCGCGKKDAAEAQAVQQRYAALTGAVAEAEIVSHPEGETRSFTVRCTCDRTKDTATTTVMAPEELAGLSATVTGEKLLIQYDGPALAAGVGDTVSPANCIPYLLRALAEGYVLEVGEETLEDIPCLRLALDTTSSFDRHDPKQCGAVRPASGTGCQIGICKIFPLFLKYISTNIFHISILFHILFLICPDTELHKISTKFFFLSFFLKKGYTTCTGCLYHHPCAQKKIRTFFCRMISKALS